MLIISTEYLWSHRYQDVYYTALGSKQNSWLANSKGATSENNNSYNYKSRSITGCST